MVKFLIIGDLHGQIPELHFKGVDAIIAPGDFCSDAHKKIMFEMMRMRSKDPALKLEWYDMVSRKEADAFLKKSLADGRKLLEFLNKQNVPVFLVPGNWDYAGVNKFDEPHPINRFPWLVRGLKNLKNVHLKRTYFEGVDIIGAGISDSPEFPQTTSEKKRYTKQRLKKAKKEYASKIKKLDLLFSKAKAPVVFLSHNVPYNTPLDLITWKESPRYGQYFGSVVARKIIEKHQPLVCIGAHMHEHFTSCKIGKTVCINSGFGPKVNVLLEIKNGKIKEVKFYPKEY